jgi:hypothetical protein
MDPRSVVAGAAPAAGTVLAEHAVFTSIRSPWGRGYRLVAASTGISPDEKREIVPRAPAHQSICDAAAHGCGLASFTMQSGRRCVLLAQNAGVEHSARGDYRVHTHVLVLEPAAYRRLRCDPLVVGSAARAALGDEWLNDQPPPVMPRLMLAVRVTAQAPASDPIRSPDTGDVDGLLAVLSCVLHGRRVLVHGPIDPLRVLAWMWSAVPFTVRDALSLSCGLRISSGRRFPLILTAGTCSARQRSGLEQDFALIEWPAADRPEASEFDPWLSFVRRRWATGQLAELDQLSTELSEEPTAADLSRVAALCDDITRLAGADLALVDALMARYAGGAGQGGASARLYAAFRRAAAIRREQLQEQQEEAGAAALRVAPE